MWSVESASRDAMARLRVGQRLCGVPRIRGYLRQHPRYLGADNRNIFQSKRFRGLHGLLRLIHREPVDREERIDVPASARRGETRCIVYQFFGTRGIAERPQQVAAPQKREPGAVVIAQPTGVDLREDSLGLLTPP